jgi:ribonucleoside-diphosphate reductase alpha chain
LTFFFETNVATASKIPTDIKPSLRAELFAAIIGCEIMPSMRALMTAGPALERDHVAAFNCSYLAMDYTKAFADALYVLMCGTGVGFSVERQFITKLPEVAENFFPTDTTIVVADSKLGWATALNELITLLYQGQIPKWDVSKIRAKGERLKTFGGRASGPEPLVDLFKFCIRIFKHAAGRKLDSLEVHDIVCKIGDVVVVGGVRRSACISLSNPTDRRMRDAKIGQWWETEPQRALANNSACYTERPGMDAFFEDWAALYKSKSGERGMFSRAASKKIAARNGRRDVAHEFGTNPCSEIILRSQQFCNLTTNIIREDDTLESLKRKIRLSTILGTFQATLTNFRYLGKKWKQNTEEEALLGVSLTGILDNPLMSGRLGKESLATVLTELKQHAITTNQEWAEILGINPAAAVTCVKPEGTTSQLTDSASGIHPRYSRHYLRTVRQDNKDPLTQMMKDAGVYWEPDYLKKESTTVFYFPQKSPDHSVLRDEMTALEQLELWQAYQDFYCEHKPSITVYVREHEWLEVGAWVYKHFDSISGISFLPYDNGSYQQAPYQEITEEEYVAWVAKEPKTIDFDQLSKYETTDEAVAGIREYACVGGSCELK